MTGAVLAIANCADSSLFWSNARGWTPVEFDTFTGLERETLRPPAGGVWTVAPLLCHYVRGRRYVATRGEPRHATLESYKECVRVAYGILSGVTFGTYQPGVTEAGQ